MLIYKIFTRDQWDAMRAAGQTAGAPIDIADGFVHFSTAAQVRQTAALHFAEQDDLWLIQADADKMPDLKWEASRGGDLFPHLFAPFMMEQVTTAHPLPLGDAGHIFPDALA